MIDWDIGHYEQMAAELEPVAEYVVSLAHVQPGERVVDLAAGTGNAALLAAGAGALATGVDTAPRLIDVARDRAVAESVDASFVVGDIQALPFDDGSFDVALSVFGLIFVADARRAFDEMIRVLGPAGRALFSVWVPAGPIDAMVATFGRALAAATGRRPPRFAWHDADAVGGLAARHRAQVQIHEGQLRITAASPEAYLEANEQQHPVSVAGQPALERAGTYSQVRNEALRISARAMKIRKRSASSAHTAWSRSTARADRQPREPACARDPSRDFHRFDTPPINRNDRRRVEVCGRLHRAGLRARRNRVGM
jgi:SAM-dependent methyltransferase